MTYNLKCISSTSATYDVDAVNNMPIEIYSYNSQMTLTSYIKSKQLFEIFGFDNLL